MRPGAITGSRLGYSPSVPRAGHHHRRRCPLGSRDGTSPPCPHGCPAWSDAPHTPGHWQCAGWPASCCCQNTCQPVQYTHHYLGHVSLYSTCTTAIWDMRQSSTQYSTHTTTIWDTHQSAQYTHHHNLGHTSVAVSTVHTPPQFGTHICHPVSTVYTSLQFGTHISTVHIPPQFGTHISPVHTVIHRHNLGHLSVSTVHTTTIWHTVSTIHMSPPFGKLIQYGLNMRISHLITKQHRYVLQLHTINPVNAWPTFSSTTGSYHLTTRSILKHAHNMLNSKILN